MQKHATTGARPQSNKHQDTDGPAAKQQMNDDRGPNRLKRGGSQEGEPQSPSGERMFAGGHGTDPDTQEIDDDQAAEDVRVRGVARAGE